MTEEMEKNQDSAKNNDAKSEIDLVKEMTKLKQDLQEAEIEKAQLQEKATRALADYQNLTRRQKEDQMKMVEYARISIFESLIQPLEHLSLAAKTIDDQGLSMVVSQFWQTLESQGLKEISPDGEQFDPETMEVLEKDGDDEVVKQVLSPGYKLNGQLIKPAKVKVG